jgi:hypothetical protein
MYGCPWWVKSRETVSEMDRDPRPRERSRRGRLRAGLVTAAYMTFKCVYVLGSSPSPVFNFWAVALGEPHPSICKDRTGAFACFQNVMPEPDISLILVCSVFRLIVQCDVVIRSGEQSVASLRRTDKSHCFYQLFGILMIRGVLFCALIYREAERERAERLQHHRNGTNSSCVNRGHTTFCSRKHQYSGFLLSVKNGICFRMGLKGRPPCMFFLPRNELSGVRGRWRRAEQAVLVARPGLASQEKPRALSSGS